MHEAKINEKPMPVMFMGILKGKAASQFSRGGQIWNTNLASEVSGAVATM